MVDDLHIAEQAVGHLIGHGHRAIALIEGSSDDPLRFTVPEQRRLGYLAALRAAGIEPRPEYEVRGDFSVESGREAMARLLELPDPPTSVFAMSDEMAYGALREVWDRGLDTPGHVSIVGVDDHEFSQVVGLSTVAQEVTEHGARAAELLLDQLSGTVESPVRHQATTRLVARRTTGPAPGPTSPP
jgi:DNA-binding LacI/PurR family transcriptional regulator